MTKKADEDSFIKYKTTTMSCRCPDRKHRDGGSYILKGQRVCKHIKELRERCWKRNAERSMELLYPSRVLKRRQAEQKNEETWGIISQAKAQQEFPVGLTTKSHTDLLKLQSYCQRFVKDLETTEYYGAPQDREAIPAFIIQAAQNMNQLLKELA